MGLVGMFHAEFLKTIPWNIYTPMFVGEIELTVSTYFTFIRIFEHLKIKKRNALLPIAHVCAEYILKSHQRPWADTPWLTSSYPCPMPRTSLRSWPWCAAAREEICGSSSSWGEAWPRCLDQIEIDFPLVSDLKDDLNIYGISMEYLLNIYEMSMEYLWNIYGISMEYDGLFKGHAGSEWLEVATIFDHI